MTSFRPHYESEDEEAAQSQRGNGEAPSIFRSSERFKASGFNNNRKRQKGERTSPPDDDNEGVQSSENMNIEWKKEDLDSETKQHRKPFRGKNRKPENNWGNNQDDDNINDWGNKPKDDYDKPSDNWGKPNVDYDKPRNNWGNKRHPDQGRAKLKQRWNDRVKYREQIDTDKAKKGRENLRISWDKPKLYKNPERDWKDVGVEQDNWKKVPKFEESKVQRPRDRGRPAGRQGDSYRIMTDVPWVGKKNIYAKSDK